MVKQSGLTLIEVNSEEVGSDHVYVKNNIMLRIANSIPLRRIRKAGRDLRYLAYRTF